METELKTKLIWGIIELIATYVAYVMFAKSDSTMLACYIYCVNGIIAGGKNLVEDNAILKELNLEGITIASIIFLVAALTFALLEWDTWCKIFAAVYLIKQAAFIVRFYIEYRK